MSPADASMLRQTYAQQSALFPALPCLHKTFVVLLNLALLCLVRPAGSACGSGRLQAQQHHCRKYKDASASTAT